MCRIAASAIDLARGSAQDGQVKEIYPDGRDGDPDAVPGVWYEPESDATSYTVEVDAEVFTLRRNTFGGTDYTWLTGPNPGYGFGVSPTPGISLDGHRQNIRSFLAQVDPTTGYIGDDGERAPAEPEP